MTATGNLRQRSVSAGGSNRSNKKKKNHGIQTVLADEKIQNEQQQQQQQQQDTMWQIIRSHWSFPLYIMTLVIGLPYGIYILYLYLCLQKPSWLSSLSIVTLRPAVAIHEPRQVLIVGTMSSGTSQVAHELASSPFQLEVGHETSETTWNFVRDGTVSWFHGIRFLLPPPPLLLPEYQRPQQQQQQQQEHSLDLLCRKFLFHMGFHPRMFRANSSCSLRDTWSKCWANECRSLLRSEWGCAFVGGSACTSPFAVTLWQMRHPLNTMASLVVKFCVGGSLTKGILHPSFIQVAQGLFSFGSAGASAGAGAGTGTGTWLPRPRHNFSSYTCLQGVAHYWLEYTMAMDRAWQAGLIKQRYQVEHTTPCQVVQMAGFLDDAVYAPHIPRLKALCQVSNGDRWHQLMTSTQYSTKRSPKDLILTWNDFENDQNNDSENDDTGNVKTQQRHQRLLVEQLQEWTIQLGYDLSPTTTTVTAKSEGFA